MKQHNAFMSTANSTAAAAEQTPWRKPREFRSKPFSFLGEWRTGRCNILLSSQCVTPLTTLIGLE